MNLIQYNLCYDEENNKFVAVHPQTGEIKDLCAPKKTRKVVKKEEEADIPQLILSENKYMLNTKAVNLMQVEPGMKLSIKVQKIDSVMRPVIGTEKAFDCEDGNRLTKSFTVSCKGVNNTTLSNYGKIFSLAKNPNGTNTFVLYGDNTELVKDDAIDEDAPLPDGLDIDLSTLEGDILDNLEEINGSVFEMMLQNLN